jgi:hypothetical protein
MPDAPKSRPAQARDEEVDRLEARVEELEAELGKRRESARATSTAEERRRAVVAQFEEELTEIEEEDRDLRTERADLLEQLTKELDAGDPEDEKVLELRARLRRVERKQSTVRTRREGAERDLEAELNLLQRVAAGAARRSVRERLHDPDERFVEAELSPGTRLRARPIAAMADEGGRLANAWLMGHLRMYGAAADATSAFLDDLYTRTSARNAGGVGAAMVGTNPTDVAESLYTGIDRLLDVPSRLVETFNRTYETPLR